MEEAFQVNIHVLSYLSWLPPRRLPMSFSRIGASFWRGLCTAQYCSDLSAWRQAVSLHSLLPRTRALRVSHKAYEKVSLGGKWTRPKARVSQACVCKHRSACVCPHRDMSMCARLVSISECEPVLKRVHT